MIAKSVYTQARQPMSKESCDDFVSRLLLLRVVVPSWLGCLVVALFSLSFPTIANRAEVQWLPWLLSLFIFGLAHGGFDHQVPTLLRNITMKGRHLVFFVIGYLLLMIAMLLIWVWSPGLGLLLFLLMSAYHFGQGDLYWSSEFGLQNLLRAGTESAGNLRSFLRGVFLTARGSLPAILPFIFFPDQFLNLTAPFTSRKILEWASASTVRQGLMIGIGFFLACQIALSLQLAFIRYNRDQTATIRAALTEIAETGLLLLLFRSATPILAIGTYFLIWHSPRHVVRLMLLTKPLQALISRGQLRAALLQFHRRALPLTVVAGGLLLLLWVAISQYQIAAAVILTSAFLFTSAITLPHFLIVLWMDTAQSIWGRSNLAQGVKR